jgi:hypothetical protein
VTESAVGSRLNAGCITSLTLIIIPSRALRLLVGADVPPNGKADSGVLPPDGDGGEPCSCVFWFCGCPVISGDNSLSEQSCTYGWAISGFDRPAAVNERDPAGRATMFNQYGSVLCILCESSMRLATIEPGEAGTSTATFECRYPPCASSRVMVIGKAELGQDALSA